MSLMQPQAEWNPRGWNSFWGMVESSRPLSYPLALADFVSFVDYSEQHRIPGLVQLHNDFLHKQIVHYCAENNVQTAFPLQETHLDPVGVAKLPPPPEPPDELDVVDGIPEEDDDPHRLARTYIRQRHKYAAGYGLKFWRQQFWVWNGTHYTMTEAEQLRAELTKVIKSEFNLAQKRKKETYERNKASENYDEKTDKGEPKVQRVTNGIIANAFSAMKSLVVIPDYIEQMSWLKDGRTGEHHRYVAMKNGILDLDRMLALKHDCLKPHSPKWFSTVCLPFDYDPNAKCPKWEAFLNKSMAVIGSDGRAVGDRGRIAILQEWAGYLLTPSTDQQKFLFLEGEGANGKSVYMAGLEAMLGRDNCTHVPLEVFGHPFMLTQTVGKLANIAAECSELDNVAEGILKAFVAGDRMTFNRKNLSPIEATPTARLILSANMRPRFADRTNAIWRRMLLVPWLVQIQENEQVLGMDKVEWWEKSGELPGIFNWAVRGFARLSVSRRFSKSEICAETLDDYRKEVNPTKMFLVEHYREATPSQMDQFANIDPSENPLRLMAGYVYDFYREWCYDNGYKPMSDRSFGKELARQFPNVIKARIRKDGKRAYAYMWLLSLDDPEDAQKRPDQKQMQYQKESEEKF